MQKKTKRIKDRILKGDVSSMNGKLGNTVGKKRSKTQEKVDRIKERRGKSGL